MMRHMIVLLLVGVVAFAAAEEKPAFRTDENPDAALPWFEPVAGEFPPEEYAHYFAGELIGFDHIDRTVKLRVDRQDGRQGKDEAIDVNLLPYASIYYHNERAALLDIPIGTHLHGLFYIRPEGERFLEMRNGKLHRKQGKHGNASGEIDFTRCFRLEDDFSFHARQQHIWKVEKIEATTPNSGWTGRAANSPRSVNANVITGTFASGDSPVLSPRWMISSAW